MQKKTTALNHISWIQRHQLYSPSEIKI